METIIAIAARKVVEKTTLILTDSEGHVHEYKHCLLKVTSPFQTFCQLEKDPYIALTAVRSLLHRNHGRYVAPMAAKRFSPTMISLYINYRAIGRLVYDMDRFTLCKHTYETRCGMIYTEYVGEMTIVNNVTSARSVIQGALLPKQLHPKEVYPRPTLEWKNHPTRGAAA